MFALVCFTQTTANWKDQIGLKQVCIYIQIKLAGVHTVLEIVFITDADDFSIGKLVGTEVVAHISPASLTGKQKIGEGKITYMYVGIKY